MKHFVSRLLVISMLAGILVFIRPIPSASAQAPSTNNITETDLAANAEATDAAEATGEATLASPSAEVVQRIQEKTEQDITQPTQTQKSKLAAYLDENPPGNLSWYNPLQIAIRRAVENGLPANIIVLILLFPVIVSIIAAARHVVGLQGFGIYIPAVLSVAFVSTGIVSGVVIFGAVLLAGILTRGAVKRMRLPYLPRTAMLLWGVSVISLLLLIGAAFLNVVTFLSINIFPILIIMLLTENFMETQLFSSQKKALRLTAETLLIALIGSFLINQEAIQKFVIIRPEVTILSVAAINYAIGKFTGLRLLEYFRFQSLLER